MNIAENQTQKIIPFEIRPTDIEGLHIITMKQIEDEGGVIRELLGSQR